MTVWEGLGATAPATPMKSWTTPARAHVAGAGEASAGLTAETSETETDDEETPRGAPVCRQLRSSHRSRESQLVPMRALGPCTLSALRDPL